MSEVSMDNKIDYLDHLQMPFFIGVVNQSPGVMRVFSAELLPFLFAHKGKPSRLSMVPIDASDLNLDNYLDCIESDFLDFGARRWRSFASTKIARC